MTSLLIYFKYYYFIDCGAYRPFLIYLALFSSRKVLQNFSDSPSHRIFRRMHGVLNINENKN